MRVFKALLLPLLLILSLIGVDSLPGSSNSPRAGTGGEVHVIRFQDVPQEAGL